jgi:hypothetical protein
MHACIRIYIHMDVYTYSARDRVVVPSIKASSTVRHVYLKILYTNLYTIWIFEWIWEIHRNIECVKKWVMVCLLFVWKISFALTLHLNSGLLAGRALRCPHPVAPSPPPSPLSLAPRALSDFPTGVWGVFQYFNTPNLAIRQLLGGLQLRICVGRWGSSVGDFHLKEKDEEEEEVFVFNALRHLKWPPFATRLLACNKHYYYYYDSMRFNYTVEGEG